MDGLTNDNKQQLSNIFKQIPSLQKAVLFGSRAMGLHRHNSDVDIVLYGDNLTLRDVLKINAKIEETTMPYKFDFVIADGINEVLQDHISQHGQELYAYNDEGRLGLRSDWELVKVGDLGRVVTGKTPKTAILENYGGSVPFLTPSDDMSVKHTISTARKLTARGLSEVKNCLLPARSICISCIGSNLGKVVMTTEETVTNQQINSIIVNEDVDADFVYYAMSILGRELNFISKTSTAVPIVNKTSFSNYMIGLPSLEEQRKISVILSALDDKIANNNKINQNLEQMAQAIFKSWFVDFEPWGGTMPTDWQESTLGEFVEIKRGGSPRPIQEFLSDKGLRWLKISDVTSLQTPFVLDIKEHIKESGLKKTVFLKSGALVLSNSATPGVPKILGVDTCIHDGWLYFPKSHFSNEFLYLFFKHIRQDLVALGNGSVFTNLKTDILKSFPVAVPDITTLSRFDEVILPIFQGLENHTRENKKLASLRDTLLPRLMSGEISVAESVIKKQLLFREEEG